MGIWLLIYGVADEHHDRYLDWFHNTHVGEKLARKGYDWAAHYRVQTQGNHYIAMFGSTSSRTFFDPSPKQLKPKQDALTREMIGYRTQPQSLICTREWSNATDSRRAIQASAIAVNLFDEQQDDQDVAGWCAQRFSPALEKQFFVHQFLSSAGTPRHLTIVESDEQPDNLGAAMSIDTATAPAAIRLIAKRILLER